MHSAKRRRLEQSTSTLSKPFRSPLRVDVNKKPSTETQNDNSQKVHDQKQNNQHLQNPTFSSHSVSSPLSKPPTLPPPSNSSPTRPTPPLFSTSPARPTLNRVTHSPEYLALHKNHSRLFQQLAALRKSLDTAEQALKIESSNQDAELHALITKWRGVSREAAEELFRSAKDRVNKMGGLSAWRERTQKRDEAWGGGKEDSGVGFGMQEEIDEDEMSEEQREQLEVYRDEMRRENERYGVLQDQKTKDEAERRRDLEKENDDESFTMDMMLKQLNVELEVIGYDAVEQRWTD